MLENLIKPEFAFRMFMQAFSGADGMVKYREVLQSLDFGAEDETQLREFLRVALEHFDRRAALAESAGQTKQ